MNQEIFCIRRDEANLQSILFDGSLIRHGERWAAFPREIVHNPHGMESVIFEIVRPEGMNRPSLFKVGLRAIRISQLSLTLLPGLIILLNGIIHQWKPAFGIGILSILGALLFQISVYALNDVEDHLRLIDLPGMQGGSGVIQKGWMNAKQFQVLGYGALILGLICGIPAVFSSPQLLFWIGAVGALGVLAYSNRPIGMKYRALGGILVFLLVGPFLTLGYSLAFFGRFNLSVILIGLVFGLFAFAANLTKSLQNIELDRKQQVHSVATWIGFKKARHLLLALYFSAYLVLVLGVISKSISALILLPIFGIGLPKVVLELRRVYQASGPVSALLIASRIEASKLHLYHGLLIGLGMILSLVSI